jgi:adenylate kinase family enzyme
MPSAALAALALLPLPLLLWRLLRRWRILCDAYPTPRERPLLDLSRVWVVGHAGSGKSTTARRLAARFGTHAWIDLDELHWLHGWRERPDEEMGRLLRGAMGEKGKRWVISGNYTRPPCGELLRATATAVVWVRPPFAQLLRQLVWRTFDRAVLGTRCCNGNRESIWTTLCTRESILYYVWSRAERVDAKLTRLLGGMRPGAGTAILRSRAEVDTFVATGLAGTKLATAIATES